MHKVIEENLEAYLDGSLLPVRGRELDVHLEDCPGCRQELVEMRQTREWMLALVSKQMVAPSPGFYARVLARVAAVESQLGQVVWPFWQLFPAYGQQLRFALLSLLLLVSFYWVTLQRTEPGIMTAGIMMDAPVIHTEAPALTGDQHANRERVMMAIISPLGRVEGD